MKMDWTVRLWFALVPIFGFVFLMVLLRRGAERKPWEGTATYVVYGILAVWLLVVVLMTYFRR
jgi:hypothetical protein